MDLENLSQEQLEKMRRHYAKLAQTARDALTDKRQVKILSVLEMTNRPIAIPR